MVRNVFWRSCLVVLLVALSAQTACKRDDDDGSQKTKITVRLPIPVADTAFAPFYLGIDKGIYKKHGFDVTLEPGSPELNPVKMVSQGQDAFGVLGGPEMLFSAKEKGAQITGLALIHKDSDFVVVAVKEDSPIRSFEDLSGKKVGMFIGHISTDVLHILFKKLGIVPKEVDVGFDYGQFIAGDLDAQWAFRTTAGLTLPAKGVAIRLLSPADAGVRTQGHVLIVNEQFLKGNRDVVDRFVAATLESMKYAVDHPDEAVTSALDRGLSLPSDMAAKQWQIYSDAMTRNEKLGAVPLDVLETAASQMVDAGLLKPGFSAGDSFEVSPVQSFYAPK